MMRKRSSYRPRPVLKDPLGYVLAGVAPLTSYASEDLDLRIRNRSAFASLVNGDANPADLDAIVSLANMATAFARAGKGLDWKDEIRAGVDAVEKLRNRRMKWGKIQPTPGEIEAIRLLLDIHDAQLDAVSIIEVETAIRTVKHGVAVAGV